MARPKHTNRAVEKRFTDLEAMGWRITFDTKKGRFVVYCDKNREVGTVQTDPDWGIAAQEIDNYTKNHFKLHGRE
jgi:hypothetical protein